MNKENNIIAKLEAMLFASGEPVEASKLAELLELDIESVTKMLAISVICMMTETAVSALSE